MTLRFAGMRHSLIVLALAGAALLLAAALLPALLLAAVSGAPGDAPGPLARAASSCNIRGHEQSLGPTYVTYIGVSGGASCAQAGRLVRAYYRCRIRHGGVKGHCGGVEGFRCTESRYAAISVQYNAHVSCTRGRRRIRHDYTQFT
jgi:hypothetical protein